MFEDAVHQTDRLKEWTRKLDTAWRRAEDGAEQVELAAVALQSLGLPLSEVVDSGEKILQQARERGTMVSLRGLRDRIDELQTRLRSGRS